jgi:hypothetical protein
MTRNMTRRDAERGISTLIEILSQGSSPVSRTKRKAQQTLGFFLFSSKIKASSRFIPCSSLQIFHFANKVLRKNMTRNMTRLIREKPICLIKV